MEATFYALIIAENFTFCLVFYIVDTNTRYVGFIALITETLLIIIGKNNLHL